MHACSELPHSVQEVVKAIIDMIHCMSCDTHYSRSERHNCLTLKLNPFVIQQ